jgi:hypothetical protein
MYDPDPPRSVPLPPISVASAEEAVSPLVDRLNHFVAPGQVVELRALQVRRRGERAHTESGFFDTDHLADLLRAALNLTKVAKGVYVTLNPLKPDLLARRCNRVDWAQEGELAADKDVLGRRWLLVDADPVRDSHVSATEEEKAHAHTAVLAVRDDLRGRGWAEPVLADSGNGYHLLYRIDLPADDGGLVKRVLEGLAAKFDTERAKIDKKVFNPARICKLPGTIARKGDPTDTRKHRRARRRR